MPETEKLDLSLWSAYLDGEEGDVFADYVGTLAVGPMQGYRHISQWGGHAGQSYYMHVLDGVEVIHKLRLAGLLDLDDDEERAVLAAYTVHDINKLPPYRPPDGRQLSYAAIATEANIRTELERLGIAAFFPQWETYLPDICLLVHLHQHDSKPLTPQDRRQFHLDYHRLYDLGQVMQGVDNLDLSNDLDERKHKAEFAGRVGSISGQTLAWVNHRLGENRGLLTNIIHEELAAYILDRFAAPGDGLPLISDLLYYPEGVAYLLPATRPTPWTTADSDTVARRVAAAVGRKKNSAFAQFIKSTKDGIKVDRAALEGGATYAQIMDTIYGLVDRKTFRSQAYEDVLGRLRADLETVGAAGGEVGAQATALLAGSAPLFPHDQDLLRRGLLAHAYRNLLENHLKAALKGAGVRDAWEPVYRLMELPPERYALYNAVYATRRGPLLAHESRVSLPDLFGRMCDHLAGLVGEASGGADEAEVAVYRAWLDDNLSVGGVGGAPDFRAHLRQYSARNHRQCSTCSAREPTEEWMAANAPPHTGVQFFSNRLEGGAVRDPKRNICPVCRGQFILEKLAWPAHTDKHGSEYTTFYLHFYPYTYFTAPELQAMQRLFTAVAGESRSTAGDDGDDAAPADENRSYLLDTFGYGRAWYDRYGQALAGAWEQPVPIRATPRKLNGVGRPAFRESLGNTPTLPLTAPGSSYRAQFLFALRHALMMGDLFACRTVLSRTPTPLFTGDYLVRQQLALVVDGVPRALRWLLPADGYRPLATYRAGQDDTAEYDQRRGAWANERPGGKDGYAALENLLLRLTSAERLARRLASTNSRGVDNSEDLLLDLLTAAADDPLALYYVADRAIEQKVRGGGAGQPGKGQPSGGRTGPEGEALGLRRGVAGLLHQLAHEEEQ